MFQKLPNKKVFRDPVHNNITVEYQLISELIDAKELQRLRRIRQLSGVSMVFHTAEHSRFGHALGAYEVARIMISEVVGLQEELTEYEQLVFLCSALLHDIGHGPYSHSFEHVFQIHHETMTCMLIQSPKTEVNQILKQVSGLVEDIVNVISHGGKYPLIEGLVSSQLDVDRLDYLCRDAYFTGAPYGKVDLFRIIRVMRIVNHQIVFKASGAHSIENYLMSRYHMYWQVYYHPVARSYEIILQCIYQRLKDLFDQKRKIDADVSLLMSVISEGNVDSYIDLDDSYVNGMIKQLEFSKDAILADLASAFLNRRLYRSIHVRWNSDDRFIAQIKKKYELDPLLKRYYYKEDFVAQVAYLQDNEKADLTSIKILLPNETILTLEEYSPIVNGLVISGKKQEQKIFYGIPEREIHA